LKDDQPALDPGQFRAEREQAFSAELGDRLPAMRRALETLSSTSDTGTHADALDALVRHAHSLKGGAQLVGNAPIARLADALEQHFRARAAMAPPAGGAVAPASTRTAGHVLGALEALSAGRDALELDLEGAVASLSRAPNEPAD
jgi:chemotaxis protein histidine kinase CheA